MKTNKLFPAIAMALLTIASQARAALPVKAGRVFDNQSVQIEVPVNAQGQTLGCLIGATEGAYVARDAGWQGHVLAGSIEAAAGAKACQMAIREMRHAQQVIVQPDKGEPVAVVQEPGAAVLEVGQKVYLVGQSPTLRMVPAR